MHPFDVLNEDGWNRAGDGADAYCFKQNDNPFVIKAVRRFTAHHRFLNWVNRNQVWTLFPKTEWVANDYCNSWYIQPMFQEISNFESLKTITKYKIMRDCITNMLESDTDSADESNLSQIPKAYHADLFKFREWYRKRESRRSDLDLHGGNFMWCPRQRKLKLVDPICEG